MSLIVVIKPSRSNIELLPLRNGSNIASFKGILILQHTSIGPRPFKFRLIKEEVEDIRPPSEAVDMLRIADLILITRHGDPALEKDILMMLEGYHLQYEWADVCRLCLLEGRFTQVDSLSIRYRRDFICENCALSELHKEIILERIGLSDEGIERLFNQLLKTRDLDRMLVFLNPKKIDRELTLFDHIPANRSVNPVKTIDLDIDDRLKEKIPDTLLPVQSISIGSGLLNGNNQLVVSATATGKTLIGEIAGISNILHGRGKMLFLVPLVALANQKYEQFNNKYKSIGLSTAIKVGQSRIHKSKRTNLRTSINSDIIVGTYEGIDHLLRCGGAYKLGKVGTIVMDEVHMIEDLERGPRLDGLIARLRFMYPKCQFIYLSATVGNPGWLAEGLGSRLVEYEERPVPLERHLIFSEPAGKLRLIDQLVNEEYNKTSLKGFRGQTIVFTNSRRNCHKLSESLQTKAAAYHAGLLYEQRRRIEEDFASGKMPVVVTTAALSAGVDFPASQVIFETLSMGIDWITQGEFLQMQGRAGRPDYHDRGVVVLIAQPDKYVGHGESEDQVAFRLLRSKVPPLTVKSSEVSILEQVLASAALWNNKHTLHTVESLRLGGSDPDYLLEKLQDMEYVKITGHNVTLTRLGHILIKYFLPPEQVSIIKNGILSGLEPVYILTELEVFDQVFFEGVDRIAIGPNVRLPSRVFQGAALEIIMSGDSLARLDIKTRQKLTNFAADFLTCNCSDVPYCGCPERKFSIRLFELRCEGLTPARMIESLTARYGIFAYPADILDYLETALRHLEAIIDVARILKNEHAGDNAKKLIKCLLKHNKN
jgi:helicase